MNFIATFAKRYFKKLSSDIHSAVVSIIIGLLLLGVCTAFFSSTIKPALKKLWFTIEPFIFFNLSIPLWAIVSGTILLISLVYSITKRRSNKSDSKIKTQFYEFEDLVWEVEIDENDNFTIIGLPICSSHNLRLIDDGSFFCFCPECDPDKDGTNYFTYQSYETYLSEIRSRIEKSIREKRRI